MTGARIHLVIAEDDIHAPLLAGSLALDRALGVDDEGVSAGLHAIDRRHEHFGQIQIVPRLAGLVEVCDGDKHTSSHNLPSVSMSCPERAGSDTNQEAVNSPAGPRMMAFVRLPCTTLSRLQP